MCEDAASARSYSHSVTPTEALLQVTDVMWIIELELV